MVCPCGGIVYHAAFVLLDVLVLIIFSRELHNRAPLKLVVGLVCMAAVTSSLHHAVLAAACWSSWAAKVVASLFNAFPVIRISVLRFSVYSQIFSLIATQFTCNSKMTQRWPAVALLKGLALVNALLLVSQWQHDDWLGAVHLSAFLNSVRSNPACTCMRAGSTPVLAYSSPALA